MGSCTRRHFLLSICFLQMITIIERQVFDFLGYMWAPIFVNFFHMLFIIFGFYGAYHFKVKYIITYLIWSFCWIGWNAFLICFYLNVGELDKDSDLLNLGTGSASWFEVNGPGCKPFYPTNITSDDPYRPIRPERVDDCYLDYTIIEVIHSGVQSGLSILGIIGAICISCLFVDEDDRFDFMNGDAKSPQHTVVHPMYVSYTSIPTSASATMLSNKHHHHHQNHHNNQNQANHQQQHQHSYNNNTFLIHSNSNTPNASKNNTINSNSSRKLYSTKNKISSSTTTIIPTTAMQELQEEQVQQQQQHKQKQQHQQQYYDDSTAKADHQLYTNNNSQRQQMLPAIKQNALATAATPSSTATTSNNLAYQQQQQQQQNVVAFNHNNNNNNSLCTNTNSSLSYASLQKFSAPNSNEFFSSNSNLNMAASLRGSGGVGIVGIGAGAGVGAGLSNSNYSITNNNNNNNNNTNLNSGGGGGGGVGNGSGRFACIHAKPKPPKSSSYSNFINGSTCVGIGPDDLLQHHHRPDIKYSQVSNDQLHNFEETFEDDLDDDIISMQNFKADAATYVPFQKPTPAPHHHFTSGNNNPSYASLNSNYSGTSVNTPTTNNNIRVSPNNNVNIAMGSHPLTRDNSHFFLRNDNDLLLERSSPISHTPITPQSQLMVQRQPSFLNPASRILCQQNGLPFQPSPLAAAYKPHSNSQRPQRPSNIPLPTVPHHQPPHYYPHSPISPSDVTPPPPPAPRPHIFQPRSGHAPYPDLSPEVTEKYAMPTQYVPRSPVASRIARRQRQHQQHERSHLANTAANFCDQIRDAPPGYIDTGFNIVRAKSHDRLTSISRTNCDNDGAEVSAKGKSSHANSKDAAPNVNRRSGRGKVRPRSYCNSSTGGEGVIRGTVLSGHDNGVAGGGVISSGFGVPTASNYVS